MKRNAIVTKSIYLRFSDFSNFYIKPRINTLEPYIAINNKKFVITEKGEGLLFLTQIFDQELITGDELSTYCNEWMSNFDN